ncbi:hypothetical protein ACFL2V_22015, partial [Pseudomonadota bacterium]
MLLRDTLDLPWDYIDTNRGLLGVDTFYTTAYQFTQQFGQFFFIFLDDKVQQDLEANLLFILNGAEHLGSIIEDFKVPPSFSRLHVKYASLTEAITGPWKVVTGWKKKDPIIWVGYGDKPDSSEYESFFRQEEANNTPDEIRQHLLQQEVFDCDHLIVVDSGHLGSIVEVVASVGREVGFDGKLEGALLWYNGPKVVVNHTVPIYGFNLEFSSYMKGAPKQLRNKILNILLPIFTSLVDSGIMESS